MGKLHITSTYGVVPNHVLADKRLSFKAKGLFAYLQSKPDGWDFAVDRISRDSNNKRDSVRAGLKELENAGFLTRKAVRGHGPSFEGYDYILSENLSTENQSTGNQSTENPVTYSKKEYSKKDNSKNDSYISIPQVSPPGGASQSDATPEKTSSKSLAVKEYGAVMASHSDIVLALASVEPIFPAEFKNKDKKPYQIKATRTAVASAIAAHGLDVVIKTAADYASPAMRTHKFFKHRPQNTYVFFKNFDAIRDNIASLSPGSNLTEGLKPDPSRRKKPVILVSTNK